jgi:hypothetical protein
LKQAMQQHNVKTSIAKAAKKEKLFFIKNKCEVKWLRY